MHITITSFSLIAIYLSRVVSAHTVTISAPDPGPTPMPPVMGVLFVQTSDPTFSGYVAIARDVLGRYVVTQDRSLALPVTYADHQIFPMFVEGFTNLGATFGEVFQSPPEGPGNNAFEGNSFNFAALTGTSSGIYGEPAQAGKTSYIPAPTNFYESAFFTLDHQNNEILPTWINPDGSPKPSTFGISLDGGELEDPPLFVSMNIGSFNAIYGGYSARIFLINDPLPVNSISITD